MKKIDNVLAVSIVLLILIYCTSAYEFIQASRLDKSVNYTAYSFWNNVREEGFSSYMIYFIPLIIVTGSFYRFFQKIKSGHYTNCFTRMEYSKFMKKEIFKCYLKSMLIVPLCSMLVFIFAAIFYDLNIPADAISTIRENVYLLNITDNLFLGVIIYTLATSLFGILAINIAMILARYINKFYLLIISLIVTYELLNRVINFTLVPFILNIFSKVKMDFGLNIFSFYTTRTFVINPLNNVIMYIGLIAVSFVLMHCLYADKEKMVLENE
ncbi:MAG: hypothetical protein RR988_02695 [Clostridia bacterium]